MTATNMCSNFVGFRGFQVWSLLKKRTLPDSPDTTAVSKVPRFAGDNSSIPMNSQKGKDVGNDRSECNNANPTQPQQSTSKSFINYTVRRDRGYSSFWQQRCHYGERAEVPATLAKEILMDKLQLCDQWDIVSILFPYLQGG